MVCPSRSAATTAPTSAPFRVRLIALTAARRTRQSSSVMAGVSVAWSACCVSRQLRDRFQPVGRIDVPQLLRQAALAFEPRGDVFNGDDDADRLLVILERADDGALLHAIEFRRWLEGRARDEVMVQGGRQHDGRTGQQRLTKRIQQGAGAEIGHERVQRLADRRLRGDTGHARKRGVPASDDQRGVGREDPDPVGIGIAAIGHARPLLPFRLRPDTVPVSASACFSNSLVLPRVSVTERAWRSVAR